MIKEKLQEAFNQLKAEGVETSPKMEKMAEEAFEKILEGHCLPKEALGISDDLMEKFYSYAYQAFQAGKYNETLPVFKFLRQLDPLDSRYSFAIAASYHYKKEYLLAAGNYLVCNRVDPFNPIPYFHLYDCFLKSEHYGSALVAIQACIGIASIHPFYASLKEKALLERQYVEDIINKK